MLRAVEVGAVEDGGREEVRCLELRLVGGDGGRGGDGDGRGRGGAGEEEEDDEEDEGEGNRWSLHVDLVSKTNSVSSCVIEMLHAPACESLAPETGISSKKHLLKSSTHFRNSNCA